MFKQLTWHTYQGHRAIITSKNSITFLKREDKCLQEAILWGFHPYKEIAETNMQDLVHLLVVPHLFEEKRGDIVFGFPWCVIRGAWFRVYNRYLVSTTPPTVFNQSF